MSQTKGGFEIFLLCVMWSNKDGLKVNQLVGGENRNIIPKGKIKYREMEAKYNKVNISINKWEKNIILLFFLEPKINLLMIS